MFDLDEMLYLEYLVRYAKYCKGNEVLLSKLHDEIEKRIDEIDERKKNDRKIGINVYKSR